MDDDLDQMLSRLRLRKIREVVGAELARAEKLGIGYSELLARLFRQETQDQDVRAADARLRRAKIPEPWSLNTFPWDRQPGIDKKVIFELAELNFIAAGRNLAFIGATGLGKTGLASALLLKAVQAGYSGIFTQAQDLFDELHSTLADHSSRRLLNRMIRMDVILIDEMGYLNIRPEQANIFFKLMEERYTRKKTTIITTNLDYSAWYDFLGNKEMVSALLDRFRHRCQTIQITGTSLRTDEAD